MHKKFVFNHICRVDTCVNIFVRRKIQYFVLKDRYPIDQFQSSHFHLRCKFQPWRYSIVLLILKRIFLSSFDRVCSFSNSDLDFDQAYKNYAKFTIVPICIICFRSHKRMNRFCLFIHFFAAFVLWKRTDYTRNQLTIYYHRLCKLNPTHFTNYSITLIIDILISIRVSLDK